VSTNAKKAVFQNEDKNLRPKMMRTKHPPTMVIRATGENLLESDTLILAISRSANKFGDSAANLYFTHKTILQTMKNLFDN
jgi:hypothetical protein